MHTDVARGPNFATEVRTELTRMFQPPWNELFPLLLNFCTVFVAWFLLPAAAHAWLFDNLRGPLSFAIVLQTWMLCDVNSTNILANDRHAAIDAIERRSVARLVRVKTVALTIIIAGVCIGIGLYFTERGAHTRAVMLIPMFVATALAAPSLAAVVGVVFPYRVRSLRWRWARRRNLRATARWFFALWLPYPIVSAITTADFYAAKRIADVATSWTPRPGRPPTLEAVTVVGVVTTVFGVAAFVLGPMLVGALVARRRERLVAYLESGTAG